MSNRTKLNAVDLAEHFRPDDIEEIEYVGSLESCEDQADALDLFCDWADEGRYTKAVNYRVRSFLITMGYYREMTPDEVHTTVTNRRYAWSFKRDGVPYTQDESFSVWLEN